jgi:hypothetical protein
MSKFKIKIKLKAMLHFEINKAVAEKLGENTYTNTFPNGSSEEVTFEILNPTDYCNSWADAGPVIEKYQISLIKDISCGDWEAAEALEFIHGSIDSGNYKKNKSPLVAAMLVFLDMEVV